MGSLVYNYRIWNTEQLFNPIKDALQWYSSAIKLGGDKTAMNTYHKNRAACFIKLENYDSAVKDSVAALGYNSNDSKALFRKGPFQSCFRKIS